MSLLIIPQDIVFGEVDDGVYEIQYEMKEKSTENTSIADGYFTKPAVLIVEDGQKYIQLTVTGVDMIKALGTPNGPVDIIESDEVNDEKTVQFPIEDLSDPLMMDMHVVVPDLYDMEHQARAIFDEDSFEEVDSEIVDKWPSEVEAKPWVNEEKSEDTNGGEPEEETNVDTNEVDDGNQEESESIDESGNTIWIVLVLIGLVIVIFVIWLLRRKK